MREVAFLFVCRYFKLNNRVDGLDLGQDIYIFLLVCYADGSRCIVDGRDDLCGNNFSPFERNSQYQALLSFRFTTLVKNEITKAKVHRDRFDFNV